MSPRASGAPKRGPRASNRGPRAPKTSAKVRQERAKVVQEQSKMAPETPQVRANQFWVTCETRNSRVTENLSHNMLLQLHMMVLLVTRELYSSRVTTQAIIS